MSIYTFQASAGTTTGKTIKVTTGATLASVNTVIACASVVATQMLVTNNGTVAAFIRMSGESTPSASPSDIPVLANSSRIFTNPVPFGTLGVAVYPSVAVAVDVYFTPGTGGCI